jgi:hypothetical protein
MKHFHDEWIQQWCDDNGWTDLFQERYNHYWAFPPGAVMPEPIPQKVMRAIKVQKGFTTNEQWWLIAVALISASAIISSFFLVSPMPVILAFAFDAITFARLEWEV